MSDSKENNHVKATLSRQPGSKIILDVNVSPVAVDAAYSGAVKAVNKEVSIPGFRKGKAPEKTIIDQFGSRIKQEWRSIILENAFKEARALWNVHPFKHDDIRCTTFSEVSKGNSAHLVFEFEVSPTIPEINLNDIHLQNITLPDVSEQDVDGVIDNVRHYYAQWQNASDRPIQNGDFVILDIEKIDEPREMIAENSRFHVKEGEIAHWMFRLLIGSNVGSHVEGVSEQEQPGSEFIPTKVRMTIHSIESALLPEPNDDFAKKVGLPSMEELRSRIAADLEKKRAEELVNAYYHQLDDLLLENYKFELPESAIQDEQRARLEDAKKYMQNMQVPAEKIEKRLKELESKALVDAENNYRLFFLLVNYASKNKIHVSKEEVADGLAEWSAHNRIAPTDDARRRVEQLLLLRKTRHYIIQHVKGDVKNHDTR